MSFEADLLQRVRAVWGGYDRWALESPKKHSPLRPKFRIYCGEGRFDPGKMNGSRHQATGVMLNFQITGSRDRIDAFEICAAWIDAGWSLMFHLDPAREQWPEHPRYHVQFQPPRLCTGNPPFSAWRVPFNEVDPVRLLEFLVRQLDVEGAEGDAG